MTYRPDIDGLRAIAVLAVVVFHAFPQALPGGFTGVDVFFVISGYLITSDIQQRRSEGTFTLLDFYARRVRRIFPALLVVLLAVLGFGSVVLYRPEFEQLVNHVLASTAFAQNFQLLREAGYFDTEGARKPLLHLWSLAVEEQFYLLWPLVMLRARNVRLIACAAIGLSFAAGLLLGEAAYYLPISRFWQIMVGAALALAPAMRSPLAAAPGAALCLAAFILCREAGYPGWQALMPTAGAAMVIAGGPNSAVSRLLAWRPLVFLGLCSYSLYLWHWPVLAYLRLLHPEPHGLLIAGALALSACLAVATYRLVEQPFRRGRTTAALGATMVGLAVASVALSITGDPRPPEKWDRYAAQIADLSAPKRTAGPCSEQIGSAIRGLNHCVQTGSPTAALIGDSHADHLFDAIAAMDTQPWLLAAKNSCPPLLGVHTTMLRTDCGDTAETMIDALTRRPEVRTVVLAFFGGYANDTNFAADHVATERGPAQFRLERSGVANKLDALEAGLDETVSALQRSGKRVALVIDVPELPFFVRDCIGRPLALDRPNCTLDLRDALDRQAGLRDAVTRLQTKHRGLVVVDATAAICNSQSCNALRDGVLLYRDSHHLSARGSRLVAAQVLDAIGDVHAAGSSITNLERLQSAE